MKNPIQVFIGTLDLAAVHSVTQKIELIEEEDKDEMVCFPSVQDFGRTIAKSDQPWLLKLLPSNICTYGYDDR
jgi:ATP-dependent RNA helicase DDX43